MSLLKFCFAVSVENKAVVFRRSGRLTEGKANDVRGGDRVNGDGRVVSCRV